CCHTRRGHDQSAHAMAGEMQMGDTQMLPAADPLSESDALSQPVEPCEHCMGRSQPPAVFFALIEVSQTHHHGAGVPPPAISSQLASASTSFTAHITSRPHAPPGSSITRHVL